MSVRVALWVLLIVLWAAVLCAHASNPGQQEFLADTFGGKVPAPRVVWITAQRRPVVQAILGHAPKALRIRYWAQGGRSAWVLNEIGKEQPITLGIVLRGDKVEKIKVLAYRESRGGEVRYPFFTDQFVGAGLAPDRALDCHIDNISGATLSVSAVSRMTRLALYLQQLTGVGSDPSQP